MIVKICGITRREDAEVAVAEGASALGFVFYPHSPRYVPPEKAAALGADLNIWKVGVLVDETPESIAAIMRVAKLDVAQIYGGQAPDGVRVWRAFRGKEGGAITIDKALTHGVEAMLLDGPSNGKGFNWAQARDAYEKVVIAGGLNAANVAEAIRTARPWGVDASSSLETSPGIKDHVKVRQFIRAAKESA